MLRQELHQDEPNAFIVEALSAKLHRWRPLPASDLLEIFKLDNAWILFRILAPARRWIVIIRILNHGGKSKFCYHGPYSSKIFRFSFLILCVVLAYYFLTSSLDFESDFLWKILMADSKPVNEMEIIKPGLLMTACALAYCMTALHAISILLSGLRIYSLNKLLFQDASESNFRFKNLLTRIKNFLKNNKLINF